MFFKKHKQGNTEKNYEYISDTGNPSPFPYHLEKRVDVKIFYKCGNTQEIKGAEYYDFNDFDYDRGCVKEFGTIIVGDVNDSYETFTIRLSDIERAEQRVTTTKILHRKKEV